MATSRRRDANRIVSARASLSDRLSDGAMNRHLTFTGFRYRVFFFFCLFFFALVVVAGFGRPKKKQTKNERRSVHVAVTRITELHRPRFGTP